MSFANTSTRTLLNEMIQSLANPDLSTSQGRLDYKALVMTKTMADLLDLPELDALPALILFRTIARRLRNLVDHQLMLPAQRAELLEELRKRYADVRPELLDELPTLAQLDEGQPHA